MTAVTITVLRLGMLALIKFGYMLENLVYPKLLRYNITIEI